MGRLKPCQKAGTHACGNVASHAGICGWMAPVGYVAHVSDRPSPSALPPRRDAVMAHLAHFRGLAVGRLVRVARRLLARLWRRFKAKRDAILESLPAGARAKITGLLDNIRDLEADGLHDLANEAYREIHHMMELEIDVRSLEEVTEALNASLDERLRAGQLGGGRTRVFRFAGRREAAQAAEGGVLAHGGGQGHLSWSLSEDTRFKKRPVALSLGLTSNMTARLAAVAYRSPAFSAPGSRPARMEEWRGTKSWDTIGECEVRLRTPVPAPGLDLEVYLRWPTSEGRARSLRKRLGRRKVFVSRSWPPDL